MSYFHKHDNENLYEFLSCEIIGAKDGFEPSSYRDISYTIYHWKYFAQYLLSAWCATTNLKAMLTDGFCFPFLLVPQTTLHIGSLCFMANCLLPHLLITGWLLTIYSIAWFMMPFLGLDATQRESMITTQRVVDALICLFCKGFPVYLIFQSVGKSVTNLRGALSFRVKDLSLLALYI